MLPVTHGAEFTRLQVLLYTFVLIMPMMLLSGLTTPVSNMPAALQFATLANPLRFAIDLVQREEW